MPMLTPAGPGLVFNDGRLHNRDRLEAVSKRELLQSSKEGMVTMLAIRLGNEGAAGLPAGRIEP
ncbi:MAG: hypothetical protein OEO82_03890 [Gammaproteobacteria bacterium]|nr:hypothetical protein [Gammaproteobacteria bacterium]